MAMGPEASSEVDALIDAYLDEVRDAVAPMPKAQGDRVLAEMQARVRVIRRARLHEGPVAVKLALDRLGDPRVLAAVAGRAAGAAAWQADVLAPWLLLLGGFAYGLGWVIGLLLLWTSDRWSVGDKLLGTLVWPGGLALPVALFFYVPVGTGGSLAPWAAVPTVILALAMPVVVASRLIRTRRPV